MDNSRVTHVAEGRDALTIAEFKEELPEHQCNPAQIINISADMSPAFKKGVQKNFPWNTMTFDKFYVIKLMNEVVDSIVRAIRARARGYRKVQNFIKYDLFTGRKVDV